MGRATKLTLQGFKSQNVVEELTGCDLFVGPNGVGKSARTQGFALAYLGYIPGNGKQPGESMKLCAGDEMTTGLTLDTGFSFSRTFARTRKNKRDGSQEVVVSSSLQVSPGEREKTDKERQARVAREIGNLAIVFDWQEF
jgi:exonuclease SbcC